MAPPPTRLFTLASSVLAVLVDGYASAGDSLPGHQAVVPGLPAWDCAGVYVQVVRVYGTEGNVASEVAQPLEAHPGHSLRGMQLDVSILRCVPTVDETAGEVVLPSKVAEESAALRILTDAQRMTNVLVRAQAAGELPGCSALVIDQWVSIGPSGGLGGGTLSLRVAVGG